MNMVFSTRTQNERGEKKENDTRAKKKIDFLNASTKYQSQNATDPT